MVRSKLPNKCLKLNAETTTIFYKKVGKHSPSPIVNILRSCEVPLLYSHSENLYKQY